MAHDYDILAFGAHPDDVELGCGGVIAKAVAEGKKVGIVDLTRGELGTRGSAELRKQEAAAAASILGVSQRINLGFADGFFENNPGNQLKVIEIIRAFKPKTVLCNAIDDRHIDHPRAAQLVADACFLSGLRKIETQIEGEKQEAFRPHQVFHYIQWMEITPDFVVDISGYEKIKLDAVKAYGSQFFDPNNKEPETPITSLNFLESVTYRSQNWGRLAKVSHAEAFTSKSILAVKNFEDFI